MITNDILKDNARKVLATKYWIIFCALLIAGMIGGAISSALSGAVYGVNLLISLLGTVIGASTRSAAGTAVSFFVAGILSFSFSLVVMVASCSISGIITVGVKRFTLEVRQGKDDIATIFFTFTSGKASNIIRVTIFKYLYICLWSLLFVIPGIIKTLEYFMIDYMLAENPDLSQERAFEITKRTMDGEKAFLFTLGLSFIGWILLCLLTCGFGAMFLSPYIQTTMAEYYTYLRTKALTTGIASETELPGITVI
ncbi:MAG: DUF975 family protein [Clostridiales bacterium]|nr:DUF975 family protein [Clostridiales bacterium]